MFTVDDQQPTMAMDGLGDALVVAQDLTTAYLGNEDLDHRYRVMESLVLRVKRPGAICSFEK